MGRAVISTRTSVLLSLVILGCLPLVQLSCALPAPPDSRFERAPEMSELAGTWVTSYESKVIDDKGTGKQYRIPAVETIILDRDATYKQMLDDTSTHRLRSNSGRWRVWRHAEGKVYVSLSNMRYYLDGIEYAEAHPRDFDLILQGSLEDPDDLALCDPYVDVGLCYVRRRP